jgi:ribonuclease P/MRP protein subunit POP5
VKHLPKHLQPRWRYLVVAVETWPDADVDNDAFQRALWYGAQNLLGDAGSAALDLSVMQYRPGEGRGEAIVRTRRGEVDRARAVVACVDEVADQKVGLRVVGVSGTVQSCEEKYMRREREDPEQRHVVFEDAQRSAVVRDGRVDVRTGDAFAGATILDCH